MKLNYLLTAVVCVGSFSAFAATHAQFSQFSYSTQIPATALTCESEAQRLAQQIQTKASEVQNVRGECVMRARFADHGEPFEVYNLRVTYDALNRIELTSVALPNFDFDAYDSYTKYRSCLNDLTSQSELFEKATGLKALAAYCVPLTGVPSNYVLKIDAVGIPTRTLQAIRYIGAQRFENNPEFKKQILDFVAHIGGLVAKVDGELIAYYADPNTHVGHNAWLQTDTAEQCNAQAAEVDSMLHKLGAKNTLLTCQADHYSMSGLPMHYYLETFYDKNLDFYFPGLYEQTFYSYDECMTVRQSALHDPAAADWQGSYCTVSEYGGDRYNLIKIIRF